MTELDFGLATTEEIVKEIAQRAKRLRRENIKYYGDQKQFAKHIGISYRTYQQFENHGKITLPDFIDVLRGLNALDDIQNILRISDDVLFQDNGEVKKKSKRLPNSEVNEEKQGNIKIPDMFSL